ncbi:MAG: carboxypeptidase-like regulatory domain-containing protein [Bacteroidetes bacterium]|nr:carboxypeptidase-like regulatory domain-containing protein [Bacteroidota bacterium]
MKRSFLIFVLYSLLVLSINAQVLSGVVIDAQSKKPLPYVHIGVMNKNMGVISQENGKFEIDLTKANKNDDLAFSMLGYEVVKKRIADIELFNPMEIKLVEKSLQLNEVIVRKKKPKPIKLGRFTPSATTIGHNLRQDFGFGGEWGLRIFSKGEKYWIDNVQFHMRFNTVDSILFRIQIYSVKDGMPNQSLLAHDTFVTSRCNQHWIVKNLERENLILDQDVIVTYEVVRIWFNKKTDNEIFFTYGKGYPEGQIYSRASSLDRWELNQPPPKTIPVAMFLSVTEY